MDTSGKIYHDPTAEEIKAKKLVRVDHPTREQLDRGYVKARERCPCGSGKMVKNCCAKNLRHLGTELNKPRGNRWGGPA